MTDPTEIFSSRVQNYTKYRPGYPRALIDLLQSECQFSCLSTVADIGSGPGLLTELFLKHGNRVYGVEPNPEMRAASEKSLNLYPKFTSLDGRAESTGLRDHCVDFITVGQAFHWFETEDTRAEFARILKPEGWVVILYNILNVNTPFLAAYARFNQTYLGDKGPEHEDPDLCTPFFGKGGFTERVLEGETQVFDFHGLSGRVLSRANAPQEGDSRYHEMIEVLRAIYEDHQQDGKVKIQYHTQVVYGRI
jgi:SAM-dependent methyltransferase